MRLTDLPGNVGKVASDKKIIYISAQMYIDGNRDYSSRFSLTFETADKFLIVFVKLILGKRGVDGVTGLQSETDIR